MNLRLFRRKQPEELDEQAKKQKDKEQKEKAQRMRRLKRRAYTITLALLLLSIAVGYGLYKFSEWNKDWSLHFQSPIQNFIRIEPRTSSNKPRSIFKKAEAKEKKPVDMSTEEYITYVFGSEAPLALKIANAESGMRCDAQNVNRGTNSLDVGVFQINSVHLKKGWKVGDLLDCHKNIEYAKDIRDDSGWCAWTTFRKAYPKKCK